MMKLIANLFKAKAAPVVTEPVATDPVAERVRTLAEIYRNRVYKGETVTLHNSTYDTHETGTLHSSNESHQEPSDDKPWTPLNLWGTHTIIRPDGTRYRTYGYLTQG